VCSNGPNHSELTSTSLRHWTYQAHPTLLFVAGSGRLLSCMLAANYCSSRAQAGKLHTGPELASSDLTVPCELACASTLPALSTSHRPHPRPICGGGGWP
jgi:hypothetical protein